MKRLFAVLFALAAPSLVGCNRGVSGGPGVTDSSGKKTSFGQVNNTFNLNTPLMSTSIIQGETKAVSIAIQRGNNFDEDVTLSFADLPKGVTFNPARPVIKHGDTEAKLTLQATNAAALGDFGVSVTGHPTKGSDAVVVFRVNVSKK